ncbi:hypothetical protein SprV_0200901400 [Sparganum proliferum]
MVRSLSITTTNAGTSEELRNLSGWLAELEVSQAAFGSCSAFLVGRETGFNPLASDLEEATIIETVQFTEGMILMELMQIKESTSPGPDEIPENILEELAYELAKPLFLPFHTSLPAPAPPSPA